MILVSCRVVPHIPERARASAFRVRRVAANARIDLKYGPALAIDRRSGGAALNRSNSDYAAMQQIWEGRIAPDDVLVDVGCSSGRVINSWLHEGRRNTVIGIELDSVVAERTRERFRSFENVEIVVGDAIELLPEHGTVFYLFNPFEVEEMAAFADRVARLPVGGQSVRIIYYNCKHLDVFEADERWDIERVQLEAPAYAPLSPLAIITRR